MEENSADSLRGVLVDGRYRVQRKIARGGMATVYLATDERLDRSVALKVLHPYLSEDGNFLSRLGQEAKAAAKLSDPHVVGVLDQGDEFRDGHHSGYLVMEYLPGHTLREVIRNQAPLSPRQALSYFEDIVAGLAAAHSAALVHRDVKPENVLIADDGRVKIGDFGLARAVTASTTTGTLIGTVAYLSPELVLGKPAGAASDIYAAGIVLYELLTGHQPFTGDVPIQVAYQHVNSTVPAPSATVPGLSTEMDELVRWCTEPDPEKRPTDGQSLLQEIRHIRATLPAAELDFIPPRETGSETEQHHSPVAFGVLPTAPTQPPNVPDERHADDASETEFLSQSRHIDSTQALSVGDEEFDETTMLPADGGSSHRTEFIPQTAHTMYLDQPRALADSPIVPYAPDLEGGQAPGSVQSSFAAASSGKMSKRQQRLAAKADAAQAAKPTTNLSPKHGKRRGLILILIVVLLAILGGIGGWFFGMGPGALATVPELRAQERAQAVAELDARGFPVTTREINDETVPAGAVVGTEPPANSEQRKFQGVVLMVSTGPTLYEVPTLTDLNVDQARALLSEKHLSLGSVTEAYDESRASGQVLNQKTAPGTRVRAATTVDVTVSKGPQPLPIPSTVGMSQDDAVAALQKAGFTAVVDPTAVNDPKIPQGNVVSQNPSNGTAQRSSTVTIVISKGPKLIDAPNQFGKDESEAVSTLKSLGFNVKVSYTYGRPLLAKVVGQDQTGPIPEGSTINLTVV